MRLTIVSTVLTILVSQTIAVPSVPRAQTIERVASNDPSSARIKRASIFGVDVNVNRFHNLHNTAVDVDIFGRRYHEGGFPIFVGVDVNSLRNRFHGGSSKVGVDIFGRKYNESPINVDVDVKSNKPEHHDTSVNVDVFGNRQRRSVLEEDFNKEIWVDTSDILSTSGIFKSRQDNSKLDGGIRKKEKREDSVGTTEILDDKSEQFPTLGEDDITSRRKHYSSKSRDRNYHRGHHNGHYDHDDYHSGHHRYRRSLLDDSILKQQIFIEPVNFLGTRKVRSELDGIVLKEEKPVDRIVVGETDTGILDDTPEQPRTLEKEDITSRRRHHYDDHYGGYHGGNQGGHHSGHHGEHYGGHHGGHHSGHHGGYQSGIRYRRSLLDDSILSQQVLIEPNNFFETRQVRSELDDIVPKKEKREDHVSVSETATDILGDTPEQPRSLEKEDITSRRRHHYDDHYGGYQGGHHSGHHGEHYGGHHGGHHSGHYGGYQSGIRYRRSLLDDSILNQQVLIDPINFFETRQVRSELDNIVPKKEKREDHVSVSETATDILGDTPEKPRSLEKEDITSRRRHHYDDHYGGYHGGNQGGHHSGHHGGNHGGHHGGNYGGHHGGHQSGHHGLIGGGRLRRSIVNDGILEEQIRREPVYILGNRQIRSAIDGSLKKEKGEDNVRDLETTTEILDKVSEPSPTLEEGDLASRHRIRDHYRHREHIYDGHHGGHYGGHHSEHYGGYHGQGHGGGGHHIGGYEHDILNQEYFDRI